MRKSRLVVAFLAVACSVSCFVWAQESAIKNGLHEEDWAYTMPGGLTTKEVKFYSDGVACFAQIFFPRGYTTEGKTPAVVLAPGWTGTAKTIAKFGARFADRGLVAMVIDYRGWGRSDGYATVLGQTATEDSTRFTEVEGTVRIARTRLLPLKQVEDFRNAISFIQGEPGVDADAIGIWGSSYAGGHMIAVASVDARVKAAVAQLPAIGGRGSPRGPVAMDAASAGDAVKRAREGMGGEFETGFSMKRNIDVETIQMNNEYRPFHVVEQVAIPVLLIVAENDELVDNANNAFAAAELLENAEVLKIPGITHFEMYIDEAFEQASNTAADWFAKHLELDAASVLPVDEE